MKIGFAAAALPKSGAVIVFALANKELLPAAKTLDKASNGALTRAIATSRFTGEKGQILEILALADTKISRVLIYGLGKANNCDALTMEAAGGEITRRLITSGEKEIVAMLDLIRESSLQGTEIAARFAYGAYLGSYRFDKYRTTQKPEQKPSLKQITVGCADAGGAAQLFKSLEKVAEGVFFTRDLVTEPANIIYPKSLAKECRKLETLGVKVEILGETQMQKLGMGALLGVGQGSERESQLVVMQWNGAKKSVAPIAFVGKGVCFDTGGISIKPAAGMEDMKWDMGGAGTVVGLMRALAGRKAKANVVGIIGLVENMPSGTAQRPGDVVTSMSGQTIEVLNTDAEGRLVLADALWYCQDRFKPKFMIDLATLTGAIIIALGHENAGLFANDDELAKRIVDCAQKEGEGVWRLPLAEAYDRTLESSIADIQNIAGPGAGAGSITAAQFLQRFVNKLPWAHLDIAGVAWSKKDRPTVPKGASAFGVRLLNRLVQDYYETR